MNKLTEKGYSIRKIVPEDNEVMAAIVRHNLKANGLDIPGTAYFDTCLDTLSTYYHNSACGGYYVLTAQDGTVVGGIGFEKISLIPQGAELQKMYLDDLVKGQGLSYVLIAFIEDRMREAGLKHSYLETHSNLQTAIHVYEKSGYQKMERPREVGHSTMDHFYIKNL